jgi:hypothetical protein
LDRDAVKRVINPMLHGQTEGNLVGLADWEGLENRRKVERLIAKEWPPLIKKIRSLRDEPDLLQHKGAQIFFACYDEALRREDLAAGIPIHDGWTFAASDERQLLRVRDIFSEVGSDLMKQRLPVRHEIITL